MICNFFRSDLDHIPDLRLSTHVGTNGPGTDHSNVYGFLPPAQVDIELFDKPERLVSTEHR